MRAGAGAGAGARAIGCAALAATLAGAGVEAGGAPSTSTMRLGVQTHFAQGWGDDRLDLARRAGATFLRDAVPWARVESEAGRYDVARGRVAALDAFCRKGGSLLLVAVPLHPLHDGGGALRSPEARAAFARYVAALHEHFGACLAAIEIGNEVNAANSRQIYRPGETAGQGLDPLREYVATVRAARDALRRRGAATKVLGGSVNMIATGFLDGLFARGLLDAADGIAVHPYRSQADNLDAELAHLDAAMRRGGRPLPVWATEFSDNYPRPEMAAPQLVKAVTLLAASGVEAASWYALVDQKWFRNMGLYGTDGSAKAAAGAFALAQRELLAAGPPRRVDIGDPNVRLYRFGADRWVGWGASGRLIFSPSARLVDARGAAVSGPSVELGDAPVIALGSAMPTLAPGPVIADSLLGYGGPDWSYLARRADGTQRTLGWLDGQWTSHRGDRFLRPLWVGDVAGAPAGAGAGAARVIVRYTSPAARLVSMSVCIDKRPGGDGIDVAIHHGNEALASAVVTGTHRLTLRRIALGASDRVDLVVGPHLRQGLDGFRYRIRIAGEPAVAAAECPERPASTGKPVAWN